jgi:hypothetical protein
MPNQSDYRLSDRSARRKVGEALLPDKPALRIGDYARLNSGSPTGLVVDVDGRDTVILSWRNRTGAYGDRHGIDLWAIAAELVRRSTDTRMRLSLLEASLDAEAEPLPSVIPLYRPAARQA